MPTQNRSHVPLGSILEGKYRVTREIGRGGMAAVYDAVNVDIGKRVAVKVLAAELITSRVVRERFIREARAAAAIRSPHICDVYDSGMYEERPFLIMELLEGESLYDLMTRVRRLDVPTTLRIMTQTCRGLMKAHEANVIHRDLKPENIFLTTNEDGDMIAKILDFGLAKFYEPTGGDAAQARLTREGALFGTPAYMSPEQAKGQGEVDHRCDLWALGCITYECLTGQTVWNVDQGVAMILAQIAGAPLPRPSKLRPDLPRGFDHWFARALDRDIENRFQTARDFAETLTETLQPSRPLASQPQVLMPFRDEPEPVDARLPSAPAASARFGSGTGVGQSPAAPQVLDRRSPVQDEGDAVPRAPGSSTGRAVTALLTVGALAFGAYAFWLYVLNPPLPTAAALQDSGPNEPVEEADASDATAAPLEREAYALQLAAAQEWLAKGQTDNALRMFKEAYNNGGSSVSRALLTQVTVASESKDACTITGLGRPRPFDLVGHSSQPTLALTRSGPVVAWTDNHIDPAKPQGYAVLLDDALRRVSMTHAITPEARTARDLELQLTGDSLAAIYCDRGGSEPGVYVRPLERDGRIAGAARRVSATTADQNVEASLARAEDGTYWAVWTQMVEAGVRDLMARKVSAEFAPAGEIVRLTRLRPTRGMLTGVTTPAAAVAHGQLYVAFALERGLEAQLTLLRAPLDNRGMQTGVAVEGGPPRTDKAVGSLEVVSSAKGKNVSPRMACAREGCLVVWDNERGGAFAAYVSEKKGEKLWHRELAARGSRPNVARAANRGAVVWIDSGRLRLALMDRDGVGPASLVAKVTGFQPAPALVAGSQPGQWYIAWRDYESGHLETFVARAQCR